jgi:hypothetical protein
MANEEYFFEPRVFKQKEKKHIDLKDISEQKFIDLIGAKNQDKRFYGWLHFHPIFDDSDEEGYH